MANKYGIPNEENPKLEHNIRLKTPALYALEVYLYSYVLDDMVFDELEDTRFRFKFLDFACVEAQRNPNSSESVESPNSPPSTSSPTTSPSSPSSRAGEQSSEGSDKKDLEENVNSEATKKDESKEEINKKKDLKVPMNTEKVESSQDVLNAPDDSQTLLKRDLRYFDPRKLLRPKQPPPSAVPSEQLDENPEERAISSGEGDDKPHTNDSNYPELDVYGEGEELSDELTEGDYSIPFDNGSSLIFCLPPLNMLHSLPRYPLLFFLFKPHSNVIGYAKIHMDSLLDAVDKSVVLTKSIPLSGVIRDSFEIFLKGKKLGTVFVEIKLTCFGPYALHRTYLPNNPNDKSINYEVPRRPSQQIIVIQMSATNLGEIRHKSKTFISKWNTTLMGKIRRDISEMTPIVSGEENYCELAKIEKPELTVVEREELEAEKARIAQLQKFPQFQCLDDWEIVFNRNVIKDLILKNRRPFQWGSPDRKYVESYFPDLMPKERTVKKSKPEQFEEKLTSKKDRKRKLESFPSMSLLPLEKEWLIKRELERIRRKSVKPAVTTKRNTKDRNWSLGLPSTHSLVKLPKHTSASMSHVAVTNFDLEKGEFHERDSKATPQDYGALSYSSVSASYPGVGKHDLITKSRKTDSPSLNKSCRAMDSCSKIFNTKHPRMCSAIEKYNPLPDSPYSIKIDAPERYPSDKMEQTFRDVMKEIELLGGDTKMLYDHDTYRESALPEHLKRCFRTLLYPETSVYGDGEGDLVYVEVAKGVPVLLPARCTPYWDGHVKVCDNPINCNHFLILHPGFGYYGK